MSSIILPWCTFIYWCVSTWQFFSREYIPLAKKTLMSTKRPGINVKLHLDLDSAFIPGEEWKFNCPLAWHSRRKFQMGPEAQSLKGRLEEWTYENWGPDTTDENPDFSKSRTLNPQSQPPISTKSRHRHSASVLVCFMSDAQHKLRSLQSARVGVRSFLFLVMGLQPSTIRDQNSV